MTRLMHFASTLAASSSTGLAWRARRSAALVLALVSLGLSVQPFPAVAQTPGKLAGLGSTRVLEVLPLVDWNVANSRLRGEAGVSYLIRTDQSSILFDVGGNLEGTDPSPLVANMRQLGIKLADIDTIVISHNHTDHVGGLQMAMGRTFSLDYRQVDLQGKRVFVPISMTYPGIEPIVARAPTVLAPGVATTGPIPSRIYIGPVNEQALAINVEGKGLVLIVGCGHQTVPRLLERTAELFDGPIYGVIGGLHYPVPHGRWINKDGVDVQRWASYGPDNGPSADDVQRATLTCSPASSRSGSRSVRTTAATR